MSGRLPSAPRGDHVELIAGHSFPDPFRPLEDADDPAVQAWQRAENDLADSYIAGLTGVDILRARVAKYSIGRPERDGSIPRYAGGKWFRVDYSHSRHARVLMADQPFGSGCTCFDAGDHVGNGGTAAFLSWISPSPNGRLLAVGLCRDGSEANSIRVVEAATGHLLDDRPLADLMDNWMGGAQWLADSSGFFYVGLEGEREAFQQRVFRHTIGQTVGNTPEAVPLVSGPGNEYLGVFVSRSGRWAVVSQNLMRPKPVAILNLRDPRATWQPFITDLNASMTGHVIGDEFIAITDSDAPRGRVVGVPLTAAQPADSSCWRHVVAESDAVLRAIIPVGELFYLSEYLETYARIRIVDAAGTEVGLVPLPAAGAIAEHAFPLMTLSPTGHPDEYVFAFSSLVESWGVYRHRPGQDETEVLRQPEIKLDAVVEDCSAESADGTRIPYRLVRRSDIPPTRTLPTLIYAYGGFNAALTPQWPKALAAFVDAGGALIHAHLRGGGEFGLDWWEGGRMDKKQNCYDDLYAVAEDLLANGRTRTDCLAVVGGSGGGLMAGVAITQRPELWRAAIPRVPFLDVLGACREPYGRFAVAEEFGNPDDPGDVARLATFSPYQLIKDGTPYPAVYVYAGATDPRCPPWHARKFVARLQEATASDRPVFLRVWENAGHGWATAKDVEVEQQTAWLAFVIDQLDLARG